MTFSGIIGSAIPRAIGFGELGDVLINEDYDEQTQAGSAVGQNGFCAQENAFQMEA
jgi:hypothetical protein